MRRKHNPRAKKRNIGDIEVEDKRGYSEKDKKIPHNMGEYIDFEDISKN